MQKRHKPEDFVREPQYPGGHKSLDKFISQNLKYPVPALHQKIEGAVHMSYNIHFDGSVNNIRVMDGIGFGCNEEAIRLVSLLKYKPWKNRGGVRVSVSKKIVIHFRLPKDSVNLTYDLKSKEDKPPSYNYTIEI